mmetsp:Transcript_34457/g.78619  ORF Transcript_34457/g.78619 Transcript_34457/m.78619 type:complete len:258 (-) Transcript_34457:6-779(-)
MTSSSAEGTEEATQYTGEKLVAGNDFFANFSSVFLVIAIAALLIALYVFREQWLPFLYERTVGSCYVRSIRDYACCGHLCSCCCGCCIQPYHPKYRLVLTVERVEKLKTGGGLLDWASRAEVYVQAKCGKNPTKTTSTSSLRSQATEWNEELELDILTSDASINIAVLDEKQNLYGRLMLDTTSICDYIDYGPTKPRKDASADDSESELELAEGGKLGQPSKLCKGDEVTGLLYLSFSKRGYGESQPEAAPLIRKGH